MPVHDFLFLLASFIWISLNAKNVKFLKYEYLKLDYPDAHYRNNKWENKKAEQDTRDAKLLRKFPQLHDEEKFVSWSKDEILDYIAHLPDKPREMLFDFFDSLQDYVNQKGENVFPDLTNDIKGQLIEAIGKNRRK